MTQKAYTRPVCASSPARAARAQALLVETLADTSRYTGHGYRVPGDHAASRA